MRLDAMRHWQALSGRLLIAQRPLRSDGMKLLQHGLGQRLIVALVVVVLRRDAQQSRGRAAPRHDRNLDAMALVKNGLQRIDVRRV